MATPKVISLLVSVVLVSLAEEALGQPCLHKEDESAGERSRRQAAVQFVIDINAAQARAQRETGRYASLSGIRQSTSAPLGFVPRIVVDQFGYIVKLTDALDACGFAIFSDERGVVFEAHPTALQPRAELSSAPSEKPAAQQAPIAAPLR
jgi:hypothetical protein